MADTHPRNTLGLPVDEFDVSRAEREIGFQAGTVEEIGLPPSGWAHRHTFYEIAYIASGQGSHVVDFRTYPLRPRTVYFLRPDQVHSWNYDSPIEGYLITFTDGFLFRNLSADWGVRDQRLLHRLADTGEIQLAESDARAALPLLKAIIREHQAAEDGCVSVLQAYLHILLVKARRVCPAGRRPPMGSAASLARSFIELVTQQDRVHHSVRACSDALGVTPGYLAETVKEVTGRTPGQIIRASQLIEAERLLIHSDKTVAQIAYALGFQDAAYFGRFFKRECGVTPGDFRQGTHDSRRFDVGDVIPDEQNLARVKRPGQTMNRDRASLG